MKILQRFIQILEELLAIFSYPLGQIINPYIPTNGDGKEVILIVERWFNTNGIHKLWVNYLTEKGFAVYMINFPIQKGNFENSAEQLKDYIENHKLKNITLVGISGGGLTAYTYLQHHDGWKNIKKFIAIGTPFFGTPMALFISFVTSGKETLPWSKFIKNLIKEKPQHSEKITCLTAVFDEMVPQKNCLLPGTKHVVIDVIGHNNFHLDTKKTYDTVARLARE